MGLETFVGKTAGPYEFEAQASRIQAFCSSVGARHSDACGPPTFMTVCRQGEFELLTQMGIPLERVLHGEQEYFSPEEIVAGDRLSYTTQLAQAIVKRIGTFLIFETEVSALRPSGAVALGSARTTIVVRG